MGPSDLGGPLWLTLGQTRLGLAVGADRLPAPATFRFESNRFWFPVASWDHLFSSSPPTRAGADVGAFSMRSGALCSRCLPWGGDDVSWTRSMGFRNRCPLAGLKLSRRGDVHAAFCLELGVGLTHFRSLEILRGRRVERVRGGRQGTLISLRASRNGRLVVVTNYTLLPKIAVENCLPFP